MHRPHARTTQGPVRACHGSHLLEARPPSLEHPSISSTLTVGDDVIADGVTLLNVVRMLGPGEPVRTDYRVLKTSFHKSIQLPRPPGTLKVAVGLLGAR